MTRQRNIVSTIYEAKKYLSILLMAVLRQNSADEINFSYKEKFILN